MLEFVFSYCSVNLEKIRDSFQYPWTSPNSCRPDIDYTVKGLMLNCVQAQKIFSDSTTEL